MQYSTLSTLLESQNGIGLLSVPWSMSPKISEKFIDSAILQLENEKPSFHLLDEDNEETRIEVSQLFPEICNPKIAIGAGSIIWVANGQPAAFLHGGQNLTQHEVFEISRKFWK